MPRSFINEEDNREIILYDEDEVQAFIEDFAATNLDQIPVHWLSDEEYAKAMGQLRLQITGIFDFLKVDDKLPVRYMYGMGDFVPAAINEIVRLTEDFGLRVRGIDHAISLEIIRRKRMEDFK